MYCLLVYLFGAELDIYFLIDNCTADNFDIVSIIHCSDLECVSFKVFFKKSEIIPSLKNARPPFMYHRNFVDFRSTGRYWTSLKSHAQAIFKLKISRLKNVDDNLILVTTLTCRWRKLYTVDYTLSPRFVIKIDLPGF